MENLLPAADRLLIDRHFGSEDALDQVDSVLVMLILSHMRRSPAVNRRTEVALTAIYTLSGHDPAMARSLMAELDLATFGK